MKLAQCVVVSYITPGPQNACCLKMWSHVGTQILGTTYTNIDLCSPVSSLTEIIVRVFYSVSMLPLIFFSIAKVVSQHMYRRHSLMVHNSPSSFPFIWRKTRKILSHSSLGVHRIPHFPPSSLLPRPHSHSQILTMLAPFPVLKHITNVAAYSTLLLAIPFSRCPFTLFSISKCYFLIMFILTNMYFSTVCLLNAYFSFFTVLFFP